jgi:hypothetical protein
MLPQISQQNTLRLRIMGQITLPRKNDLVKKK